jgi:ribosomal-protein-alanine N-acetyltransferase
MPPPPIRLRALRSSDRRAWIAAIERSAGFHAPWAPRPPPGQDSAARFAAQLGAHESGSCWKGVAVDAEGGIVAWANLNEIVRGNTFGATAGWAVHADHAGTGVATEAVRQLLQRAFHPHGLGLHRVSAGIMPANHASLRVAEKVGFRREGFAPRLVRIAGRWEDLVLLGVLEDEVVLDPAWAE